MSITKSQIKSKVVAGAVLVALSGFVPQPLMQHASADTATINVSGTLGAGITLANGVALNFGSNVGTNVTGTVSLTPAAARGQAGAFSNGGAPLAGTIGWQAATAAKNVDVTVAGFTQLKATTAGLTGVGAAGTITLDQIILGGIANGPFAALSGTYSGGTATTKASATNVSITDTTTDISVGGRVSWSGGIPIGSFSTPIVVTIAF